MENFTCKSLEDTDKETYERFCKENRAPFLQSWDWGQWQKENGNEPVCLGVFEDAELVCTAQFLKHTTPLGEYLYCPYGPVFNIKSQNSKVKIIEAILQYLSVNYPSSIFTRFEPTTDFPLHSSLFTLHSTKHIQPGSTIVSDLEKTEEQILASMHSKTRYGIRVAEKFGIQVRVLEPAEFTDSAKLFVDTLARRGLSVQSEQYFLNLMSRKTWNQLSVHTFGAFKDNTLLATALCIDFGYTRVYLYGGSGITHKEKMPSYLLHWHILKDAKAKGLTQYDWWGAENSKGEKPGFVTFKERFGGENVQYPEAFDVVLHPLKYKIYKILRVANRLRKRIS